MPGCLQLGQTRQELLLPRQGAGVRDDVEEDVPHQHPDATHWQLSLSVQLPALFVCEEEIDSQCKQVLPLCSVLGKATQQVHQAAKYEREARNVNCFQAFRQVARLHDLEQLVEQDDHHLAVLPDRLLHSIVDAVHDMLDAPWPQLAQVKARQWPDLDQIGKTVPLLLTGGRLRQTNDQSLWDVSLSSHRQASIRHNLRGAKIQVLVFLAGAVVHLVSREGEKGWLFNVRQLSGWFCPGEDAFILNLIFFSSLYLPRYDAFIFFYLFSCCLFFLFYLFVLAWKNVFLFVCLLFACFLIVYLLQFVFFCICLENMLR